MNSGVSSMMHARCSALRARELSGFRCESELQGMTCLCGSGRSNRQVTHRSPEPRPGLAAGDVPLSSTRNAFHDHSLTLTQYGGERQHIAAAIRGARQ